MSETAREVELALDHRCRLAVVLGIFLMVSAWSPNLSAARLEYRHQTKPAPLKGLDYSPDGKDTIDWGYLALSSVMKGPFEFDWTNLEKRLEKSAAAGKTTILRPVMDVLSLYPAVPYYLTNIPGATFTHTNSFRYPYSAGITVPVYTNEATRTALFNFIERFGAKYDGDPRIAFVETGLLGAWGESYRVRSSTSHLTDIPPELEAEVLKVYSESFKRTQLMMRWPKEQHLIYAGGYHDDWFADWRGGPDNLVRLQTKAGTAALNLWKRHPIGARLHPHFGKASGHPVPVSAESTETFEHFIKRDRISWVRFHSAPHHISPNAVASLDALSSRMGYELYVSRTDWKWIPQQSTVELSLTLTNTGIAPFYYPWKMEAGLWQNGRLIDTWPVRGDLRQIIPGEQAITFSAALDHIQPAWNGSRLVFRIINPLKNGFSLRFANQTQDQDLDGWLTLGTLELP